MTFEANLITFRGIKSGPIAFLGILILKQYFAIETTTQDNTRQKKACKALISESKGVQARINDG